ncbi:MAG: V-type ATP synthase subunit K [Trueperaceae bacterium]|nr:MAG: V-type ATP synthase subunit K [Trueperaceae bacterium]
MSKVLSFLIFLGLFALFASLGFAQEAEHAAEAAGRGLGDGLLGIGAGLAIGIAAVGVGIAQAGIGSAGAGTLAEKPEAFGQILIYLVIPETLIIFGFVIAFFLNGQIGG